MKELKPQQKRDPHHPRDLSWLEMNHRVRQCHAEEAHKQNNYDRMALVGASNAPSNAACQKTCPSENIE